MMKLFSSRKSKFLSFCRNFVNFFHICVCCCRERDEKVTKTPESADAQLSKKPGIDTKTGSVTSSASQRKTGSVKSSASGHKRSRPLSAEVLTV